MKRRMISVLIATALLFNVPLTMPIASFGGVKAAASTEMGNRVKEVFLRNSRSAAIMENGDLYCWGYNGSGQVGNGQYPGINETKMQTTPIKILENVKKSL